MLSLRQMDSIVHSSLRSIKGLKIENREEKGTYILYNVSYNNSESGIRFSDSFQVWEYHDGSARAGWMPYDINDSEIEKIRNFILQMIMAIAVPANQANKHNTAQPANMDDTEYKTYGETVSIGEHAEKLERGDADALAYDQIFQQSEEGQKLKQQLQEASTLLLAQIDKSFENHPSKPFYEMLKSLRHSENPVHRALARSFGNWTIAEIEERGAKYLMDELSKSAKELPAPIDQGKLTESEVRERMKKLNEISLNNSTIDIQPEESAIVRDANVLVKILNSPEDEFMRLIKTIDNHSVSKDAPQPVNTIADNQGGTITYRRNEQGQTIITGGTINPGYYAELGQGAAIKPEHIRLNHTTGNFQPGLYPPQAKDAIIKVTSETLAGLTENADTQEARVDAAKPEKEEAYRKTVRVSKKTEALNKLAVMWVNYNQKERISKDDDMEWFIGENAETVGLNYLTVNEFKKHLPKAFKAQIIDKDEKTGRFIPKLAT